MKKMLFLMLAMLVLLCACDKVTEETTAVTTVETTAETALETTAETTIDGFKAAPSEIVEIEALPYGEGSAMIEGGPVGGNPRAYVFDIGTTYYVKRYFSTAEGDFTFYKCKLALPNGYTNGRIIAINGGAGSGETFITALAEKDGVAAAFEYFFFCETISEPTSVRKLDEIPESPLYELFKVVSNPANLDINSVKLPLRSEKTRICEFEYDERYMIYVTAEILKNDRTDFRSCAYDLFIVDKKIGDIVFKKALNTADTAGYPKRISYVDDGCIIHDITVEGDVAVASCAYKISENDGEFTVEPTMLDAYPSIRKKVLSPSGKYTAYENELDGWNNGGIEVKYPDGTLKRILTNVSLGNSPECKAKDIGDAVGYGIVGFADDTHLAYSIGGYEWLIGYGIYDLESGKATEYRKERDRAVAACDGYVFVIENKYYDYEPYPDAVALYKMSLDGTKTTISNEPYAGFENSKWRSVNSEAIDELGRTTYNKVDIFSLDFKELLAQVEYVSVSGRDARTLIYDNTITVVMPQIAE